MSEFTRRSFIGKTAVAIGSFAALQKIAAADRSGSDPGPANTVLDGQNPDSIWPPGTDSKSLVQNFKYPFSFANKRTYEGGWSREVTVRELPVSKTLAGVNMRLTAGGVRELHDTDHRLGDRNLVAVLLRFSGVTRKQRLEPRPRPRLPKEGASVTRTWYPKIPPTRNSREGE